VVLDPVMVATSGDRLLAQDAVEAIRRLLPLASLITPNLDEAADLLRVDRAVDVNGMLEQGRQLLLLGAPRVLIKGGHLPETSDAIDVFVSAELEQVLSTPRITTMNTHGTGCTLSSAIAALRPQRGSWLEAVTDAKHWLSDAIAAAQVLDVGQGHGPVHHFHRLWAPPTAR